MYGSIYMVKSDAIINSEIQGNKIKTFIFSVTIYIYVHWGKFDQVFFFFNLNQLHIDQNHQTHPNILRKIVDDD